MMLGVAAAQPPWLVVVLHEDLWRHLHVVVSVGVARPIGRVHVVLHRVLLAGRQLLALAAACLQVPMVLGAAAQRDGEVVQTELALDLLVVPAST